MECVYSPQALAIEMQLMSNAQALCSYQIPLMGKGGGIIGEEMSVFSCPNISVQAKKANSYSYTAIVLVVLLHHC
jgi:hypothetical protein